MKGALWFEEVGIVRVPGFEKEGFTLCGLSPGINLVHGPNASGKTTTARALERLLWPRLPKGERFAITGRFRLSGAEWRVDVDGSRVAYQREGHETSGPILPAMEDHHRYRLSLHDLLHERDQSFARAVVRETAGGYDVRAAGAVLQPREGASRRTAEREALARARGRLDEAVAVQRELREREMRLTELREQLQAAKRAADRVKVLEAALEHATARENESVARAEFELFPLGMAKIGGYEYDRLCDLRERLKTIDADRKQAAEDRANALAVLEGAQIPDEATDPEFSDALEKDLEALREAEREVATAARVIRDATARLDIERTRMGSEVNDDRLAALDHVAMGSMAAFVRRAENIRQAGVALDAALRLLGEPPPIEDEARLADGIRMLRLWLRTPAPAGPRGEERRVPGMAAAALLALLGIALGVLTHPLFFGVTLIGLGLAGLMLRRPAPVAPDARDVYRRDYGKLPLEAPAVWEAEAVERVLEALQERMVAARMGADRERQRRELENRRLAQRLKEEQLEREGEEVAARLGVAPSLDPPNLAWLAERISGWQAAHAELAGAERGHEEAATQAHRLATGLRQRLEPLGFAALGTSGELAGAFQAFRQRRQARELALQSLATAEREGRRLEVARTERQGEMRTLFVDLGLDPDSDDTVRDWCGRHANYLRAREAHRDAGTALREALARLTLRGGNEEAVDLPLAELETRFAAEQAEARKQSALADEISRTEALIDSAKESHDIEVALEEVDRAEEALREAREQDARAVIARELLAYVQAATRDQHLPAVFLRARELFTRITHGRYELRLQEEGETAFSAFDNQERRGRTLDELSGGSRVQLLIAVRVAFVEQREQGTVLPLVLDEVLGNSDNERARAIMEATLELAREGRQIFYFTAQTDEVARWRAMVATSPAGVELREIDLLQVRGGERALEIPAISPAAPRRPPAPEGLDHADYGRRLSVPRLDRATVEPGSVHLWYLVEDPVELYQLLLLGTERWGALQALARDGGRVLVDERLMTELSGYERALITFLNAAKVGIGLPVNRAVLADSDAISATFLDRVDQLARSVQGDGRALLEELGEGGVPQFRREQIDRLREYLQEQGYIDLAQPLSPMEIRARVLGSVASEVESGVVSMEGIDRLLSRLWIGLGGD
jgi:energy-coupling factor transporter ATP-binding protein EcfA2